MSSNILDQVLANKEAQKKTINPEKKSGSALEQILASKYGAVQTSTPEVEDPGLLDKIGSKISEANKWLEKQSVELMETFTHPKGLTSTLDKRLPTGFIGGVTFPPLTRPKPEPWKQPTISAAKTPTKPGALPPLPRPQYTGNKAEQVLSTFASNAADALSRGTANLVYEPARMLASAAGIELPAIPSVATTPQGVSGETAAGVVGQVAGSWPALMGMGKVFHWAIEKSIANLPVGMQLATKLAIQAGFTADMLTKALESSKAFVDAKNAGDIQGMINAGSSAIIDTVFAFFIAKGLPKDAASLQQYAMQLEAYKQRPEVKNTPLETGRPPAEPWTDKSRASLENTYNEPFTGLDNQSFNEGLGQLWQPSEELQKMAKEGEVKPEVQQTVETIQKKRTKKERTPKQIAADKERMAKVRRGKAKLKEKKAAEQPTITGVDTEKVPETKKELTPEEIEEMEIAKFYEPQPLTPKQVRLAQMMYKTGKTIAQISFKLDAPEEDIMKAIGVRPGQIVASEVVDRSKIKRTESPKVEQPKVEEKKVEATKPKDNIVEEEPVGIEAPLTGNIVTELRINPEPRTVRTDVGTLTKSAREITKTPEGSSITPGKWVPGQKTIEVTNYDIEGYNPKTDKWEVVDVAENPEQANETLRRWQKALDERLGGEEPGTEEPTAQELIDMLELEKELKAEGTTDRGSYRGPFAGMIGREKDTLTQIAEQQGKPVAELTDADIERAELPRERPVEDIDIDTGSPDPVLDVPVAESPFRTTPDITKAQANNYRHNPAVAKDFSELLESPETKSPLVTLDKLKNDVNRIIDGDQSVDAEKTKNFISDLAARADDFKWTFLDESGMIDEVMFGEFKKFAQDLAVYAREAKPQLVTMNSGIPLGEQLTALKDELKRLLKTPPNMDREAIARMNLIPQYRKAIEEIERMIDRETLNSMNMGLPLGPAFEKMKPWFSAMRKYAEEKLPKVADAAQILNTLRKGSTQDEWMAVGLSDILEPGKRYTKEEILRLIDEGSVELKDVILSKPEGSYAIDDWSRADIGLLEKIIDETKFSNYQEPGRRTNYKELFVTAPNPEGSGLPKILKVDNGFIVEGHSMNVFPDYESAKVMQGIYAKNIKREQLWSDGHPDYSDIENPIVRLRMNDRVDSEGKKVLFLEEVQPPKPSEQEKMPVAFRKRWREIGMKRALKYAIDNGYDKVAWTTGEMQLQRYPDPAVREGNLAKVYDQDIPNVVKKLGGKVESVNIEFGKKEHTTAEIANIVKRDLTLRHTDNGYFYEVNKSGEDRWGWDEGEPITAVHPFESQAYSDAYATVRRQLSSKIAEGNIPVQSTSLEPFKSKASEGFAMYSGVPVGLKSVFDYFKRAGERKKFFSGEHMKELKKALTTSYVDTSGNIKKDLLKLGQRGYEAIQALTVSKSGGALAKAMYDQMTREVYHGMRKVDEDRLDILTKAMLWDSISKTEKGKKFNYPKAFTLEQAQAIINNPAAAFGVSQEKADWLVDRANAYFEWMRKVPADMKEMGQLIGEQEVKDLQTNNYQRLKNIADIVDKENPDLKKHKISVYDSGVQVRKVGKPTDLFEKSSRVMAAEFFNRAYGRIMKNQANIELLKIAKENRDNPFVMYKERPVRELDAQPTDRRKLIDSIMIKKNQSSMSDYEYRSKMKETMKTSSMSKMTNEQLAEFDKLMGEKSYGYDKVKKGEGQKIPSGWKRLYVYENGQRRTIHVSPEMASEWITSDPEITYRLATLARWASGAQTKRVFATGINWAFAVKNLPRDIVHIWTTARTWDAYTGQWKSVYSPHLPKAAGQMTADIAQVWKDAWTRRGQYVDSMRDGIGMDWLTTQGRVFHRGQRVGGKFDHLMDVLGYLGTTSEMLSRLALRRRVIKNLADERGITFEEASKDPKIRREATYVARDYMDFSQGGNITKAVDTVWPYLNATVQGTRGFMRNMFSKDMGPTTMYKMAQLGLVITGLYALMREENPELAKQLKGSYDENNNLIIPFSKDLYYFNEDGQKVYPYAKISLDNSQRLLKAVVEASIGQAYGDEVDLKRIAKAAKELSPVDVTDIPIPTLDAIVGYLTNKDTWSGKDIYRGEGGALPYPLSANEITPGKTPKVLEDIGKVTGLSPDRLKYVLKQLFAKNELATIAGASYDVMRGVPPSKKPIHLSEAMQQFPMAAAFVGVTNPAQQFYDSTSEIKDKARAERIIKNNGLLTVVNEYLDKGTLTRADVMNHIYMEKDRDTREKMKAKFRLYEATQDLPNRSFWFSMTGEPTEVRAQLFLDRLNKLNSEELAEFNMEISEVKRAERRARNSGFSIFTPEFRRELAKQRSLNK